MNNFAERLVGVAATYVILRGASRMITGISFPGTALATVATVGAAVCRDGQSGGICGAQKALNWPGDKVGQLAVGTFNKVQSRRQLS